jgi:histidinol dehydrogenase
MKRYEWNNLAPAERRRVLSRPALAGDEALEARVEEIVARVRRGGDAELVALTHELDGVRLTSLEVERAEFAHAETALTEVQRAAIRSAAANIEAFHRAQLPAPIAVDTAAGVRCERLTRSIASVGLYVPAGSAPLPSTALMLGIPARLAGCATRILCSPAQRDGRVDAGVLYAAQVAGVERVFKLGGAQAIAAMAYGTESVPKADKVFGPGNRWVTAAKAVVDRDPAGAARDFPAGPSEVMVIADDTAEPAFVAADLLSQAEHGRDSQVLLVTASARLADAAAAEVERQKSRLSRETIVDGALAHSSVIVVDGLAAAFEIANEYAPEHLILQIERPRDWLARVQAAGSVFLGPWAPESVGDYCSGTNHVLPTYGYARRSSSLGVTDFCRSMTVQELSPAGLRTIGPVAETLAELEGLEAHRQAVTVRLEALERGVEARNGADADRRAGVESESTVPAAGLSSSTASAKNAESAPGVSPDIASAAVDELLALARPDLRRLRPYVPGAYEPGYLRLNANESPWRSPGDPTERGLNIYPPPRPFDLRRKLARHYGAREQEVLVTRGSSEAIDTLIRGFCEARRDRILITPPTFDMYRLYAGIQSAGIVSAPLTVEPDRFVLDVDRVLAAVDETTKLVFLCTPNNPTGQSVPRADVERICSALRGRALVVIDEAYHEFAEGGHFLDLRERYEHVVLMRTLSKFVSLAGVRCGVLIAAPEIIDYLGNVLPPYTFPTPSIELVMQALSDESLRVSEERVGLIKRERRRLADALRDVPDVLCVYASDANFVLVKTRDGQRFKDKAHRAGILVRTFAGEPALADCVRITIGRPEDNDRLLSALAGAAAVPLAAEGSRGA